MSTPSSSDEITVQGVVVGDDGSARALEAIEYAVQEAVRRGSPLHVVRAWSIKTAVRPADIPGGITPSLAEFRAATEQHTRARLDRVLDGREIDAHVHAPHGSPDSRLLELSHSADVVVVGDRGVSGIAGRFLGSTADALVREAGCPVVVVRHRPA
ncbi:universal stress protein [Cumulibacter manganitolerans]|uniref:universal stress protein n=1 Tax=Cumulibacter manganitolerans TaxID=1884992 RepID=UPI001297C94C|nr:universal stress protein [Cumulibacter manganitolerans]